MIQKVDFVIFKSFHNLLDELISSLSVQLSELFANQSNCLKWTSMAK